MNETIESQLLSRIVEQTVSLGELYPRQLEEFWPHLGNFVLSVLKEAKEPHSPKEVK